MWYKIKHRLCRDKGWLTINIIQSYQQEVELSYEVRWIRNKKDIIEDGWMIKVKSYYTDNKTMRITIVVNNMTLCVIHNIKERDVKKLNMRDWSMAAPLTVKEIVTSSLTGVIPLSQELKI